MFDRGFLLDRWVTRLAFHLLREHSSRSEVLGRQWTGAWVSGNANQTVRVLVWVLGLVPVLMLELELVVEVEVFVSR